MCSIELIYARQILDSRGNPTLEVEVALKNNFIPISLGSSRLRTETAGVIACHTIALHHE